MRLERPRSSLKNLLAEHLPRRVVQRWCELWLEDKPMAEVSDAGIAQVESVLKPWRLWPSGTEGYATAEVTLGGIDTDALSSKTMACTVFFLACTSSVRSWMSPGTWVGIIFKWAWASGVAAGQAV